MTTPTTPERDGRKSSSNGHLDVPEAYREFLLGVEATRPEVPQGFRKRVMAAIDRESAPPRRDRLRFPAFLANLRLADVFPTAALALLLLAVLFPMRNTLLGHPPVGVDDVYVVSRGSGLTRSAPQGVLVNDSDPDTEHEKITARLVTPPAHSKHFALHPDGSFEYVHDGTTTETDSFTYRPHDGDNHGSLAVVTISIRGTQYSMLDVQSLLRSASGKPGENEYCVPRMRAAR